VSFSTHFDGKAANRDLEQAFSEFRVTHYALVPWPQEGIASKIVGVMSEIKNRWDEYILVLEKRATEHPIQWVARTTLFAFFAGSNTICALFGRHFLPYFSGALAIYAVATTYIAVVLFAVTLVRALRRKNPY